MALCLLRSAAERFASRLDTTGDLDSDPDSDCDDLELEALDDDLAVVMATAERDLEGDETFFFFNDFRFSVLCEKTKHCTAREFIDGQRFMLRTFKLAKSELPFHGHRVWARASRFLEFLFLLIFSLLSVRFKVLHVHS